MISILGVVSRVVFWIACMILPLAAADDKVKIKGAISLPEADDTTATASVTKIGTLNEERKSGEADVKIGDTVSINLVLDAPDDVTAKATCTVTATCGNRFFVAGFLMDTLTVNVDNENPEASVSGRVVPNPSDKPNGSSNGGDQGGNGGGSTGGGPGSNGMSGITAPCRSCSGTPLPGQTTMPILRTSSNFSMGMGVSDLGISLGDLRFHRESVAYGTVSRSDLSLGTVYDESTFGFVEGVGLKQAVSDKAIMDIVDLGPNQFEVRAYDIGAKGAPLNPSAPQGPFAVNGAPEAVYRFSGLASDGVHGAGVKIEKTVDGEGSYFWELRAIDDASVRTWRSVDWTGAIVDGVEALNAVSIDQWARTLLVKRKAATPDGEILVGQEFQEYDSSPVGELLQSITKGEAPLVQTTEYEYYVNTAPEYPAGVPTAVKGKLRSVNRPDGSWDKYQYDEDGIQTIWLRPWLSAPSDPDLATIANSRAIITEGDIRTEKILNQVISINTTYQGGDWVLLPEAFNSWTTFSGKATVTVTPSGGRNESSRFEGPGDHVLTVSPSGSFHSLETRGDWNNGNFIPNEEGRATRNESEEMFVALGTAEQGRAYYPKHSVRTTTIHEGALVRQTMKELRTGTGIWDGGWTWLSHASHSYDAKGRLVYSDNSGGIETTTYHSERSWTTMNAKGISKTYTWDTDYKTQTIVTHDVEERTETITEQTTGLVSVSGSSVGGGTLTRSRSETVVKDVLGRIVSRTDEKGRITTYQYPDALTVVEQRSTGEAVTSVRHLDGQLARRVESRNGVIAQTSEWYSYVVNAQGGISTTVHHGSANSPRWRTSVSDGIGRTLSETAPGPNGVHRTTEYEYDPWDKRPRSINRTGLAKEGSGPIHQWSYDEIVPYYKAYARGVVLGPGMPALFTETISRYIPCGRETETRRPYSSWDSRSIIRRDVAWPWGGGESETIDELGVSTKTSTAIDRATATVTRTTTGGNSTLPEVEVSVRGRIISKTSRATGLATTYVYDSLGRVTQINDPATGQSTIVYDGADQVTSVVNSNGTSGYTYYPDSHLNSGALRSATNADGKTTFYAYDWKGRTTHTWGATYPVKYEYNDFGQMVKMHTYRNFDGAIANGEDLPNGFGTPGDVTEWIYQPSTGLLVEKRYADGNSVKYAYHDNGLVKSRTWARGVVTTYSYDGAGRLILSDYSDGTPDITRTPGITENNYTVSGGPEGTREVSGTLDFESVPGSTVVWGWETYSGGLLDGVNLSMVSNIKGQPGRGELSVNGQFMSYNYEYDDRGRISGASLQSSAGEVATTYGYHPKNGRVENVSTSLQGAPALQTSKAYDVIGGLESIVTRGAGGASISGRSYQRTPAGLITRATLPDGSYWSYTYDEKGQVASASKRLPDGASIYGLGSAFDYDEIGNRESEQSASNLPGQTPLVTGYTANNVNQYSGISNPSSRMILGEAVPGGTVEVNGVSAARQGSWFAAVLSGNNSSGPDWLPVSIKATQVGAGVDGADLTRTESGRAYLPPANERLQYDADGNLISDGRWNYTWDGENRLIAVQTSAATSGSELPMKRVEYAYDSESRRISRSEPIWNADASQFMADPAPTRYVWQGWTLLAELKAQESGILIEKTYSWGLDLSDTLDTTGNVGNLLAIVDRSEMQPITLLPSYDGNGNIVALTDAVDASLVASYDYNAFGRQIMATNYPAQKKPEGTLARVVSINEWGFSTKTADVATALLYYGYRYCDPGEGRWLSRDPIAENGGLNLFVFIRNNGVNRTDLLGNIQTETWANDKISGGISPDLTIEGTFEWGCMDGTPVFGSLKYEVDLEHSWIKNLTLITGFGASGSASSREQPVECPDGEPGSKRRVVITWYANVDHMVGLSIGEFGLSMPIPVLIGVGDDGYEINCCCGKEELRRLTREEEWKVIDNWLGRD